MKSAVARSRSFCASHLDILFKSVGCCEGCLVALVSAGAMNEKLGGKEVEVKRG